MDVVILPNYVLLWILTATLVAVTLALRREVVLLCLAELPIDGRRDSRH